MEQGSKKDLTKVYNQLLTDSDPLWTSVKFLPKETIDKIRACYNSKDCLVIFQTFLEWEKV